MDIGSIISSITSAASVLEEIPESAELQKVLTGAMTYIPEDFSTVIKHASRYFPSEMDLLASLKFMLYFSLISMVLGGLGRVVLGKRSSLNRSLSSVMGILFVYAATIVIYTFHPWNSGFLLAPLPFARFSGEYLVILPISDTRFPALCSELLALILLSFSVNLIDTVLPSGSSAFSWFFFRIVSVAFSMALHLIVNYCFHTYLPEILTTYAPTVLLIILGFFLLSGIINFFLGLMITVVNPFLGAMYTFFFNNIVGKQVSKAVFSSAIICCVFYFLDRYGYTLIHITMAALSAYIPFIFVLLLLWYLIGRFL